jgi:thiol-disulfide isomerase/thioredoxin
MAMKTFAFVLALAVLLCACGGEGVASKLPDVRLPTLGGPLGPSLATCSTEKCLTVLVAPWCGVCHSVAPDIVRLRRHLDSAGVSTRVVVGLAELPQIKEFAAEFGSDALLDPERKMSANGVPLFLVTNRKGEVIKRLAGFPSGRPTPQQLAEFFGLP